MNLKIQTEGLSQLLRTHILQMPTAQIIFQEQYLVEYFLGQGRFAQVYCVKHITEKMVLAMKIVDYKRIKKLQNQFKANKIISLIEREEQLLKEVNSPFVIKLYKSYQNNQCKVLLLQFCDQSTLMTYLRSCKWCLEQAEAISIIKQICLGTYQLYRHNMIHRDLKLENIMKKDGCYKIIDLGFSKKIEDVQNTYNHTIVGTAYTMAPQVAQCLPYGFKADIYSIGVILLKLVVSNVAFDDRTPIDFLRSHSSFKNARDQPLSTEVVDFLQQALESEDQKRIDWIGLANHQMFRVYSDAKDLTVDQLFEEGAESIRRHSFKKDLHIIQADECFYEYKSQVLVDEERIEIPEQLAKQILQIKKGQYIIKEIIERIQSKRHRLGIEKKRYLKLMCLLCQRAYLSLKIIRDDALNEFLEVDTVKKMFELMSRAKERHFFYLREYNQTCKSFLSKIFALPSKLLASLRQQNEKERQIQILNGEQNENFSKVQQIKLTSRCIQQVITNIFCKSISTRLLAFAEIMKIQAHFSQFQQKTNSIIQTY